MDRRLKKIRSKLNQYDKWATGRTPEQYWGDFVSFTQSRNIINRRSRFCTNDLEIKKLIECLHLCDQSIILNSLPKCYNYFISEIQINLKSSSMISILRFFFEHFSFFRKNELLIEPWKNLLIKSIHQVQHEHIGPLLLKNLEDLVDKSGHRNFYQYFITNRETDIKRFIQKEITSLHWFYNSQFVYASFLQKAYDLYNNKSSLESIHSFITVNEGITNKKTQLICFSYIILAVKNADVEDFQIKDSLRSKILVHIGDPHDKQKWYISEEKYKDIIEKARIEIIKWQNEKVAIQFFEAMAFNVERKRFWLSHIRDMDEVKIVIYKPHIKNDSKLLHLYKENKRTFIISEKSSTSAILMKHKQYMFVEYSEHGNALYIFRNDTEEYNQFSKDYISRSTDFKRYTFKFSPGRAAGTLRHIRGWEYTVRTLLRRI
ncbi:MAG: hypothetical protein JXL67_03410 [Calditrichaeota bacterium]|nr:hypothetical protein [Calditrichota bacterium]